MCTTHDHMSQTSILTLATAELAAEAMTASAVMNFMMMMRDRLLDNNRSNYEGRFAIAIVV